MPCEAMMEFLEFLAILGTFVGLISVPLLIGLLIYLFASYS